MSTNRSLIALLVMLLAISARAEETIQLFNGKDLSGWVWVSSDPKVKLEEVGDVRDGLLHCKGTPAGYIRTEKQFTNFVIHLEWRFIKEGNGGVLLRKVGIDHVWPACFECQLHSKNAGDIWRIENFPMKVD